MIRDRVTKHLVACCLSIMTDPPSRDIYLLTEPLGNFKRAQYYCKLDIIALLTKQVQLPSSFWSLSNLNKKIIEYLYQTQQKFLASFTVDLTNFYLFRKWDHENRALSVILLSTFSISRHHGF